MRKCSNCGHTGAKRPCIYCGWPPTPDKATRTCPNCGHIGCHNVCPSCKWHLTKVYKPKPKPKPKQPWYIAEGRRRNRARERYAEKKLQETANTPIEP